MARLPASGVTMVVPSQDGKRALTRDDLQIALRELCPDLVFESSELDAFYNDICLILGAWTAESERQDSMQLAKALSGLQTDLSALATTLNALSTGLHERLDLEIVHRLRAILAQDPEVGSRQGAEAILAAFKLDAERIAHVCLIARQESRMQQGKSGRPQDDWHDKFTELLISIAAKAGAKPQLWRERDGGHWRGWLFDAARKLYMFFPPAMRAPSDEAAGKRLQRSLARLEVNMDKTTS